MKKRVCWALLITIWLAGCGGEGPSDRVAETKLREYAESTTPRSIEIANFRRSNGWYVEGTNNRCVVRYEFDWRMNEPFSTVLFDNTLAVLEDMQAAEQNSVARAQYEINYLPLKIQANGWLEAQGREK